MKHGTSTGLVDRLAYFSDVQVKGPASLLAGCMNTALRKHHYNSGLPMARTYFEAFGRDAGKEIYEAVTSTWYAIDFHRRTFREAGVKRSSSSLRTTFVHGVIVFKGMLVAAEMADAGFRLTEVPHVLLRTTDCLTNQSQPFWVTNRETVIDVVSENYLRDYISICSNDLEMCIGHLEHISSTEWLTGSVGQP